MSVQLRAVAAAFGSAAIAALIGSAAIAHVHAAPSAPSTDEYGFVDSAARCSASQSLMAYGRTARALVVICVDPDGELRYRGVRTTDGASLEMTAGRGSDGSIVATNDGVTYSVSPAAFLVSDGDSVLYRDTWTEFHQPRFSGGTTSASTATASTTTTSTATTLPTVSTTTVTPAPKPAA